MNSLKIALFGTSADPPTYGHLSILQWLAHRYDRVGVWASDNPFKKDQTALSHRNEMLRLLTTTLFTKPFESLTLKVYPELSYPRTITTVHRAREIWPQAEFTFVLGADLLTQLTTWYQAKELLAEVKLLVVPRPGYIIQPEAINKINHMGGKMTIADLTTPDISSSAYRNYANPNAVPPLVQQYIQQENLYPCRVV
jgi:nicotinate-nucleotide adenylyltransferase